MKKLFDWFADNFEKIYITSLFVISCAIVIYLFPGEGKFRYEFQKGQPWLHEDLIAPFDFAVYKMDDEIAEEENEILQNFAPYFNTKSEIGKKQINDFEKAFDAKWKDWKAGHDSLKRLNLVKDVVVYNRDSVKKYYDITHKLLESIYEHGVLEFNEEVGYENQEPETIQIVKDKVATEVSYTSVFTLKSAYTYIIQSLGNYNIQEGLNPNLEFIKAMQLNNYIVPTLFYDFETSEKVKNELIDAISLTKGMVQEGERVISKGEMIDLDKFRMLESLRREYLSSLDLTANRSLLFAGKFILVVFAFVVIYLFLSRFRHSIIESRRKTLFILMLVVVSIFVGHLAYQVNSVSIYIVPFAILPILINTFFDSRLALFIHIITVLLAAFYAPNSFEFVFIHLMAGAVAMMALKNIQKRGQFFSATGLTVITYFLLYFGVSINQEGDFNHIVWINFAWFAGNGVLLFLSFPLVYVFEKTFKFISDITLMELSDTNQKILRELAENAPGTFQHSMQVANLAEEVIRNIGGNPLLVRTGALYHDIGKLANPAYFTENQVTGMNPHNQLSYVESAAMIISHVTIGLEMAKKAKLPDPIIDFIQTHHGTTKVQYFYRLYKKENPDAEDIADKFTYPGPKPFSKETAVMMMSDSIEAASRSLKEYSKETLNDLVENIINYQIKEEQFDNATINFAEITEAKKILKNKLQNIYHARIEYPKEE
jgi:putative nucleotidyltransferase with HDIG domain